MKLTLFCIFLLNIADVCFTQALVDSGVREGNVFVRYLMERMGSDWWVVKMAVVLFCLTVFYRYRDLVFGKLAIHTVYYVYLAVVIYQIILIKGIME